jgi:hypothetical protein
MQEDFVRWFTMTPSPAQQPQRFIRVSFITLNSNRLFTAEQVSDLIEQHSPHPPAPSLIITDMEGDAIGDCTDCEAHYESMGESDKLPCSKEAHAAITRTATLATLDEFQVIERMHDIDELSYPDLYNEFIKIYKSLRTQSTPVQQESNNSSSIREE